MRLVFLPALVLGVWTLISAEDWRFAGFLELSGPAAGLNTRRAAPFDDAGFRATLGLQPGFEARYGNYGVSLSPGVPGIARWYNGFPPSRYTQFKAFAYFPGWGVEGGYQSLRRHIARYGNSDSGQVWHEGMSQRAVSLNAYGSLLSYRLELTPETSLRPAPGEGLAYFFEGLASGTGLHLGLFYGASVYSRNVRDDQAWLPADSSGTRSVFDGMKRYSLTGAAALAGISAGGAMGDRKEPLGRISGGWSFLAGPALYRAGSDLPGLRGYGMGTQWDVKTIYRYERGPVGAGLTIGIDNLVLPQGGGESLEFVDLLARFQADIAF